MVKIKTPVETALSTLNIKIQTLSSHSPASVTACWCNQGRSEERRRQSECAPKMCRHCYLSVSLLNYKLI